MFFYCFSYTARFMTYSTNKQINEFVSQPTTTRPTIYNPLFPNLSNFVRFWACSDGVARIPLNEARPVLHGVLPATVQYKAKGGAIGPKCSAHLLHLVEYASIFLFVLDSVCYPCHSLPHLNPTSCVENLFIYSCVRIS